MASETLLNLKIHKIPEEEFESNLEAGSLDANALYLTPDDGVTKEAERLTTSIVGDANTPVYFSDGKPVACTSLDLDTSGNAATASKFKTAQKITLSGHASGDVSFDGSEGKELKVTVNKDSHEHTSKTINANELINSLGEGSSDPKDADFYVAQYAGGGTATTTYHRRPHSALWNYIKDKIKDVLGLDKDSYSGTAAKAITDDKNNNIAGTYLPKSGGIVDGTLTFTNATPVSIGGDSGLTMDTHGNIINSNNTESKDSSYWTIFSNGKTKEAFKVYWESGNAEVAGTLKVGGTMVSLEGHDHDVASTESDGLMSAADKANLEQLKTDVADLLYKPISFSNSSTITPSQKAYGETVTSVTLSWSLNKTPTKLTLDGTEIDKTSTSKTISNLSIDKDVDKTWKLVATDERNNTAIRNFSVSFANYCYYGVSNIADANAFDRSNFTGKLSSSKANDFTAKPSNQYIYYAIPKSLGTVLFFVNGNQMPGGFADPVEKSVTNQHGYPEVYYIYRSSNLLSGNMSVNVE
jgi:hypothetical protein